MAGVSFMSFVISVVSRPSMRLVMPFVTVSFAVQLLIVPVDLFCDLFIVPVPDFDVVIDPAFVENSSRQVAADSIDIGQTYLSMFVVW